MKFVDEQMRMILAELGDQEVTEERLAAAIEKARAARGLPPNPEEARRVAGDLLKFPLGMEFVRAVAAVEPRKLIVLPEGSPLCETCEAPLPFHEKGCPKGAA